MSEDVKRFDRGSKTYEDSWGQRYLDPLHERMWEVVGREAGGLSPAVILDVGCGTGRPLRRAGARWPAAQLIGVDPAAGMVEVARNLAPAASIHQGVAESLPLGDTTIDLVRSAVSMHHWRDRAAGARELARVLRPRGWVCLADLSLPNWLAKILRSPAQGRAATHDLLTQSGVQVRRQQVALGRIVLVSPAGKRNSAARN
jgi:ubiquinone/menaquinone biosynthesis C-methylase UbiE